MVPSGVPGDLAPPEGGGQQRRVQDDIRGAPAELETLYAIPLAMVPQFETGDHLVGATEA